ncbi:MAG: transposase [Thermoanaerobacteraceae bacterium]|nr:transposase [Thermoanaerobacteraceae bacterium]
MAAHKNFTIEEKLAILAEAESSSTAKIPVCRKYGISKATLDYWRKQFLNSKEHPEDELAKLRKENVMLRSIIVDKDLEIAYLKELLKKNEPTLSDKIEIIEAFRARSINLDFLLEIAGVSKSTFFYKALEKDGITNRGEWVPGFSLCK